VRKLVLDAVSSPLTRVMYARALEDFFGWWTGQGRPPFTRATVQAWSLLGHGALRPRTIFPNGFVLGLACANVTNLLFAHAVHRPTVGLQNLRIVHPRRGAWTFDVPERGVERADRAW
jgi:hypothetical protein